MPASPSGSAVQFTPLQGPAATTANATILKVAQSEPQLTRTFYQDGRLLTALDLNRDYAYLDRRLLDLGMAFGDGIIQGLAASMTDGHTISVTQGRGIAPSGRVIAYSAADLTVPLAANLGDAGTQATLNGSGFSGIADGLYAVVLLHGQQPRGITEVFPRDLTTTRITYATIVDTVEIALVALSQPIPAGTTFQARAHLAAQFASAQNLPSLPFDSVALGVVAIQRGQPAWFDPALLRHPLRAADAANAVADDLTRYYQQIYTDLTASLATQGSNTFRAADVFPLLPPTGLLPRASIDPTAATQTFFPEQIDVALAPVRADEIADLLQQARGEPPIDLASAATAQILVFVPLKPLDYATLTPPLIAGAKTAPPPAFKPYPSVALPRIDPLVLHLPGRVPPPPILSAAWPRIWALAPASLPWMVRPTDGGIGGVKAAMLAAGFPIVTPPTPTPTASPAPTPTASPAPTPTASPAPTPTASPAPTPTASPAPTPTASPAPTPTASPAPTPTATPAPTLTPNPTPRPTPTLTFRPPPLTLGPTLPS